MNHINELSQQEKIDLNHPLDWLGRIQLAAKFITNPYSIVVEYGAGRQDLKNYLPERCLYYGYDKTYDGIDVELDWPTSHPKPEIEVGLGILEWLDNVPKFISKLTAKQVIVSYAPFHSGFDLSTRMANGWKNHYYHSDILSLFFECGYGLVDNETWNDQIIYNFKRIDG